MSDLRAAVKEISASRNNVIAPLGDRDEFSFFNQIDVVAFSQRFT